MRHVLSIDATALNALRQVAHESRKNGITLLLSGVHSQPVIALERSGLLEEIGADNVFGNVDEALNRARELLGLPRLETARPFTPEVKREGSGPQ
jgi:SulP family sulfate permease